MVFLYHSKNPFDFCWSIPLSTPLFGIRVHGESAICSDQAGLIDCMLGVRTFDNWHCQVTNGSSPVKIRWKLRISIPWFIILPGHTVVKYGKASLGDELEGRQRKLLQYFCNLLIKSIYGSMENNLGNFFY